MVYSDSEFNYSEFMNLWRYGTTSWMEDQPDAKASTYTGQYNTEKCGHTCMPRAAFEPAIPVFEWPKKVRDLYRAAIGTVI
jgi:hypothetical protein